MIYDIVSRFLSIAFPFSPLLSDGEQAPPSSGNLSPASPEVVVAPQQPLLSTVSGAASDLVRNASQFSVAYETDSFSGSFALFEQPGFAKVAAGRASAILVGDLTVSVTIVPTASPSVIFCSGVVALRKDVKDCKESYPLKTISMFPGKSTVNVSLAGASASPLGIPPGIAINAKVFPIIGAHPRVYFAFERVGIKSLIVSISGAVSLGGLSEVDF